MSSFVISDNSDLLRHTVSKAYSVGHVRIENEDPKVGQSATPNSGIECAPM